jgi:16S rRNA processing protein RimM
MKGRRLGRDLICVGAVAGAFGVRGEVRLKSYCARAEDVAAYGPLMTEDGRSFEISLRGAVTGGLAARLSGVSSREAAEALRGVKLFAPRAALPHLPDDEFYHADLIGLMVQDTGGAEIGKVTAVLNHGAGDLLEVRAAGGSVFIPFTREIVPAVDLAEGRIICDPPEGLLS